MRYTATPSVDLSGSLLRKNHSLYSFGSSVLKGGCLLVLAFLRLRMDRRMISTTANATGLDQPFNSSCLNSYTPLLVRVSSLRKVKSSLTARPRRTTSCA